jgi:hypothetical protein
MKTRKWVATVCYNSKLGNLDVDYHLNDLADLQVLIEQGPGYEAVNYIHVEQIAKPVVVPTMEELLEKRQKENGNVQ